MKADYPSQSPDSHQAEFESELRGLLNDGKLEQAARFSLDYAHSWQEQGFSQGANDLLRLADSRLHFSSLGASVYAEYLVLRGLTEVWQGSLVDAAASFESALNIVSDSLGSKPGIEALRGLGLVEHFSGRLYVARSIYESAADLAESSGDPGLAFKLGFDLISVAIESGEVEKATSLFEQLDAREYQPKSRTSQMLLLAARGEIARLRGATDEAESYFTRVLRRARNGGQTAIEVRAMRALADIRLGQGKPGLTLRWCRRAFRRVDRLGRFPEETGIRILAAIALNQLGRESEAIEHLELALNLASETGDKASLARAYALLAETLRATGYQLLALKAAEQATMAALETDYHDLVAQTFRLLSEIQTYRGDQRGAFISLRTALERLNNEHHGLRVELLSQIGRDYVSSRQIENGTGAFMEALAFAENSGDNGLVFIASITAGITLASNRYWAESIKFYDRALHAAESIQSTQMVFQTRSSRAEAFLALNRMVDASTDFEQMLDLARANNDRAMAAISLIGQGALHRLERRFDLSSEVLSSALELARELGNYLLQAQALVQVADLEAVKQNLPAADRAFREAGEIATALKLYEIETKAAAGLGGIALATGISDEAVRFFKRAALLGLVTEPSWELGRYIVGLVYSRIQQHRRIRVRQDFKMLSKESQRLEVKGNALMAFASAGDALTRQALIEEASAAYASSILLTVDADAPGRSLGELFGAFVKTTTSVANRAIPNGADSLHGSVRRILEVELPDLAHTLSS